VEAVICKPCPSSSTPVPAIRQFSPFALPYGRLERPEPGIVDLWLLPLQDLAPPLTRSLQRDANPESDAAYRLTRKMMLRLLLAAYLDMPARDVHVAKHARGKPYISQPSDSGLSFSQAHCLDYVLIGVTSAARLGVDVEPVSRLVRNPLALARRYFANEEYEYLRDIASYEQRRRIFLRMWTRKEAVVKATGGGIVSGLHRFVIDDSEDDPPRLLAIEGGDPQQWHLAHIEPLPGLVGTLAIDRPLREVRARRVVPPAPVVVDLDGQRNAE